MEVLRSIFCCSPSLSNVCDEEYEGKIPITHVDRMLNKASEFSTSPFYDMWSSSFEDGYPGIIILVDEEEYNSMKKYRKGFNETVVALSVASGYNVLDVPMVVDISTYGSCDSSDNLSRGFALVSCRHSDEVSDIQDFRKILALKHTH